MRRRPRRSTLTYTFFLSTTLCRSGSRSMDVTLLKSIARYTSFAYRSGVAWLPVAFLLMVATLFPFAVGPDTALLQRIGGGVIWIAALLAALQIGRAHF